MQYAVIGGAGFIGSHVARTLLYPTKETAVHIQHHKPFLFLISWSSELKLSCASVALDHIGDWALMTVFENDNRWDASNVQYVDGKILCYTWRSCFIVVNFHFCLPSFPPVLSTHSASQFHKNVCLLHILQDLRFLPNQNKHIFLLWSQWAIGERQKEIRSCYLFGSDRASGELSNGCKKYLCYEQKICINYGSVIGQIGISNPRKTTQKINQPFKNRKNWESGSHNL